MLLANPQRTIEQGMGMPEKQIQEARILIVDDEVDHLHVLKAILAKEGYSQVEGVTDPRQATATFQEYQPDIVLLDLSMPNMSGLEILDQIRSLIPAESYLPIIVVTADLTMESRREALAKGTHDFILKPYDAAEIVLRVTNLLRTRFLHVELQERNRLFQATNEKLRAEIAERELAQLALDKSNSRYQCFAAHAPSMLYQFVRHLDGSMAFPHVSEGSRELFAKEPAEIEADANVLLSQIHAEDLASFARSVDESATTLRDWRWEGRFIGFPGKEVWIQGVSRPEPQPDGSIVWDGLLIDVTERRQAQEELSRFFTLSIDMLATVGLDGYLKQVNPAWVPTLGWTTDELTSKPFLEFVHPDDWDKTIAEAARLESGQETISFQNRYRCKDGSYRTFSWNARSDPRVQLVYATARDVTQNKEIEAARRDSETKLHAIVDSTPAIVFIKDLESNFLMVNRRFETLFDVRAEDVIGTNNIDQLSPEEAAVIRANDLAVFENGRAMEFEEMVRLPDGDHIFLSVKVPLLDEAGRAYALCAISSDITERKQTEVALLAAKEEAERANHAKSEFLSRMSHELRTPLNAILGFGHLLDTEGRDPDDVESVTQIMTAGQHLLTLIDEMLDISGIEAGRFEFSIEPLHFGELVGETLSLMHPAATAREVTLSEFTCDHHVLADAQRLRQVMLNLLSNAIKYNHLGGQVILAAEEIDARMLRLTVRDTGTGISAADLPKTFTPFERLGAARMETEGIGLGLAISKRLIEMMGGAIGVESRLGEGSTFWIELPLVQAPIAAAEETKVAEEEAEEVASRSSCRLLYIEDNLSNLKLVERIMARRPGMVLVTATGGESGLQLARERQPDLILLDLHLPDLDGDKVLDQLVADPLTAAIPVIMLSADAIPGQIAKLKAAGARDYITKPLNVRNFLAKVDAIVGEKCSPTGRKTRLVGSPSVVVNPALTET